jgi:L-ascorbate metabolism protein UlaG (beta-lactamase superfamily)
VYNYEKSVYYQPRIVFRFEFYSLIKLRPNITYYGHSCFLVELSGKNILFDPFISPNPKASMIDISTIKPDLVVISHGHGDHIADAVSICKQSQAQVISVYEITEWLSAQGVTNGLPMNIGGSINLGFCSIKMVKAEHSSSFPDGSYAGSAVGFVIKTLEVCFYYAGDTALTLDMQLIPLEYELDFAFLPIGDNFTMGISDAVKAAKLIDSKKIIGMHFDTFTPIEIDHKSAYSSFSDASIQLILPLINQTFEL